MATFLLLGYLCFNRTFAYVGVPSLNAFIGEAVLVLLFIWGPEIRGKKWMRLVTKLAVLRPVVRAYTVLLLFGIFEVARGIIAGHPPLVSLRDLAFNYYPLYFFLGLWVGFVSPNKLARNLVTFAWINGIYGILYVLALNRLEWPIPGVSDIVNPVQVFAEPLFSFVAILGLLGMERNWRKTWLPLLLNAFVLIAMQFRTEWFALVIGLAGWFILSPHRKLVLRPISGLLVIIAIMYVTNITIPTPAMRAEEDLNVRQLVNRVTAPFHTDVSDVKIASGASGTDVQEGTFVWRTVWWLAIWDSVQENSTTKLLGLGYGYPLGDLVPYLEGQFIRTPHNQFFYALGYTGWIGVSLFYWFQFEIARLLLRVRAINGESIGIVVLIALTAYAFAFPLNETPYGAIPFYLLMGWLSAPAISEDFMTRSLAYPHPTPIAYAAQSPEAG
jgi:hypothetical protein